LREEDRVLRAQLGNRRLRFTDEQRRSLAVKARLESDEKAVNLAQCRQLSVRVNWRKPRKSAEKA
jgi:hypothetical protein